MFQFSQCLFFAYLSVQESMGEISIAVKQRIISFISFIGIILTLIEITCYVIIFHHIHHHNNNIGAVVLSEKIIKHRNRTNAISFFGQFLAWVMRIWYVVIFIFVFHVKISLREIIPMIKNFEFVLIPLVEIYTSAPIKTFRANN